MNKLIRNELIKIFHKKGIYIMAILILGYCLLNNILLKKNYDREGNCKNCFSYDYSGEVDYYENELANLDINNLNDLQEYVDTKTSYDILNLSLKYNEDSWQYNYIYMGVFYDVIYNINYYTYIEKDNKLLTDNQNKYNEYLNRLENDNWVVFVNEEKEKLSKEIIEINKKITKEQDKSILNDLQSELKNYTDRLEILDYRIKYNISYENYYRNEALLEYSRYKESLEEYNNKTNLTYEEKLQQQEIIENYNINKYVIETGNNIYQTNTLRSGIRDIFCDYEIFIIITVLIIAGSIVSEEYNKGTIKLLLVKPFSRTKILVSKFLTLNICLLITFIYIFIIEFIIGSICFGLDSLSIPIVIYNHNLNSIVTYDVFSYLIVTILVNLPKLILIMTLSFSLSTILGHSVIATMLATFGYIFSDTINMLAKSYKLNWIKYFVTPNWNFQEYLFGSLPSFSNINLTFSITICIIYFLIMMLLSIYTFKNKNIKNQ